MKNKIIQIGLILSLAISLTGSLQAQTVSQYRLNIPFDFMVGKKLLKSGDYSVTVGGLTMGRDKLLLRSKKGKGVAIFSIKQHQRNNKSGKSSLVFSHYDGKYILSEIKTQNVNLKLKNSKPRVQLAKNIERIEIALTK